MKINVIFAQRKESYHGQHGLEALGCETEYEANDYPKTLPNLLGTLRKDPVVDYADIVTLEVDESEIRAAIRPKAILPAVVSAPETVCIRSPRGLVRLTPQELEIVRALRFEHADNKVNCIKAIRQALAMGLKDGLICADGEVVSA